MYLGINLKKSQKFCASLRKRLTNLDFTLISNNCLGGVIYHNLGLQFKSPTINLDFLPEGYLDFISDIKYYTQTILVEEYGASVVTGVLKGDSKHNDVLVRFHHYKTFDEAYRKWRERCKRINFDNIFYLYEHYEDESFDCLKKFCQIANGNNNYLAITHQEYHLSNTVTHKHYKDDSKSGKLCKYKFLSGKRYLDEIDYTFWLSYPNVFFEK